MPVAARPVSSQPWGEHARPTNISRYHVARRVVGARPRASRLSTALFGETVRATRSNGWRPGVRASREPGWRLREPAGDDTRARIGGESQGVCEKPGNETERKWRQLSGFGQRRRGGESQEKEVEKDKATTCFVRTRRWEGLYLHRQERLAGCDSHAPICPQLCSVKRSNSCISQSLWVLQWGALSCGGRSVTPLIGVLQLCRPRPVLARSLFWPGPICQPNLAILHALLCHRARDMGSPFTPWHRF